MINIIAQAYPLWAVWGDTATHVGLVIGWHVTEGHIGDDPDFTPVVAMSGSTARVLEQNDRYELFMSQDQAEAVAAGR